MRLWYSSKWCAAYVELSITNFVCLWKNNGYTQYPQSLKIVRKMRVYIIIAGQHHTGCNARRTKYYTLDRSISTTFLCVFRLSLLKCLFTQFVPHHIMVHSYNTKPKVKQFPKRWWKRKPLKMLFVLYGSRFSTLFLLFIYSCYLPLYTQGCGKWNYKLTEIGYFNWK